uniref:Uncharacterized protein n=1 Tax=Caenorhabditis japonica TaxID=281687 RepID=A0A8R1IQG9_CAEJA
MLASKEKWDFERLLREIPTKEILANPQFCLTLSQHHPPTLANYRLFSYCYSSFDAFHLLFLLGSSNSHTRKNLRWQKCSRAEEGKREKKWPVLTYNMYYWQTICKYY